MVGIDKVSKVIVLGSLLLVGTCVQAMEQKEGELSVVIVKKQSENPQNTQTKTALKSVVLMANLTVDKLLLAKFKGYVRRSKKLRQTLNLVNKEMKGYIDALRIRFSRVFNDEAKYCHYPVDTQVCNWLINRTNLKYVSLTKTRISDDILTSLSGLISLKLEREDEITGRGWERFSNLTSLSLQDVPNFTDGGLKKLTNLTKLSSDTRKLSNEGLKDLTNLKALSLYFWDKEVSCFSNFPQLKRLLLCFSPIKEEKLANCTNLKEIGLYDVKNITGSYLKSLPNLTTVKYGEEVLLQAIPGETLSQEQRNLIEESLAEAKK